MDKLDRLATFRVQDTEWSEFQALCKESGSNASKELIGFIRQCLKNGQVGTTADPTVPPIGVTLDDVNAIVAPIRDELEQLRTTLGKSKAA